MSLQLPRGPDAPRQARAAVLERFGERLDADAAYDVALVVSELVTNSVQHAAAASAHEVGLEIGVVGDRILISVSDSGAQIVPHMAPRGEGSSKRLGLVLVDRLARSWGVARDGTGHTCVWCELPLDPAGAANLS